MDDGWIKLHRKAISSMVFANPELWKLWCLCLMLANHKEDWVHIDGRNEPIRVMPGQFVTGRFALHAAYYPREKKENKSPKTVWRWLQILKKHENLTIKSFNKFTVITVENWNAYQVNDQQVTSRCPTGDQQVTTNKNVKNEKNNSPVVPKGTVGVEKTKTFKSWNEAEFASEIDKLSGEFSDSERKNFFEYWTERSALGKMRFQLEKTWDTSRRIKRARRIGVLSYNRNDQADHSGLHQKGIYKQEEYGNEF